MASISKIKIGTDVRDIYAVQLTNERKITLSGSVTGTGFFDGSGDLTITTSTNHTHNYADSSSAGGGAKKNESYQTGSITTTYGDQWQVINQWITNDRLKVQILNAGAVQNGYPVEVNHAYKLVDPSTEYNKITALLNKGSATQPVYFADGVPVACTYSVNKTVPSDAKFTDTVYTHPTTSGNKHIPAGGSSGQILRWSADGTAAWGNDNNTTYSVATESANGLLSKEDKIKLNNTNIAYGTCTTDADVAGKTISLIGNSQWALKNGSLIMVKFTNSNTASGVTLNVNNTGAYPIWYNNAEYTSTGTAYTGYKNRTITYMFNGTHWVWISGSYDANTQSNTNSTNTSNKIFLVGATSQGSNKTTYSHDTVYVGTDGCLYSNSTKVSVEGHTHNYAGSSSAGGAANSVKTNLIIKLNGGTTEGTNLFTFNGSTAKTINITPAAIGAAAASHGTHVSYGTTASAVNTAASAGTATTVSRSDHVHSLDKATVVAALGYTPPTTNTTYESMSSTEGITGTATTNRVLTAANLKAIIAGSAAASATKDSAGNTISTYYAPKNHASTSDTYGVGNANHYGHVLLYPASSCTTYTSDSGGAVTPAAVKKAFSLFGARNGVYYVVGNTTGTAGTWTGTNTEIPELFTGLTIAYKIGIAGASATTLTLTTAAGASAAKTVKRNTGALTTHLPVGSVVHLTYDGTNWVWVDYDSNTKNTAGSTNTSSKIFLIGATSQAANPQTYSHETAYVGSDGCLYSNSTKVSVTGHTHTVTYAKASGTGNATATGTISAPEFTGTAHNHTFTGSSHNHTLTPTTATIKQVDSVGTMFAASVEGEVLILTPGSTPTTANVTVYTGLTIAAATQGGTIANTTATGTVSAPTFTGTAHSHTVTTTNTTVTSST